MNNEYCSCGNPKYADASCCEECWNRGSVYDERNAKDPWKCSCGQTKEASDASMCRRCWNKQRAYCDSRD